jgi:6-pyruvoyltetrahydropterin/6-carboxytetrahydropterin synthase
MQYITRSGTFDSGHRVMNESMKCFNLHGHTYLYDLTFSFDSMKEIGYAIDFKEIKRVACQWIDDKLDHGFIANPHDQIYIKAADHELSKIWIMSLNGKNVYCNPSVENVVKEIFLAMEILFEEYDDLNIHEIKLNETPKCYTICTSESIIESERNNFKEIRYDEIKNYANEKGIVEYDDRLQ